MEEDENRQKSSVVLAYGNIQVLREPYCYVVVEIHRSKNTGEEYRAPSTKTFHPALHDAVFEVSERLFERKLVTRAKEAKTDFESLRQLVQEHKAEITNLFGVSPYPPIPL